MQVSLFIEFAVCSSSQLVDTFIFEQLIELLFFL